MILGYIYTKSIYTSSLTLYTLVKVMPQTTTKSNLGVEVGDTEIEIIDSTRTDKRYDRTFSIGNTDNEIEVKIWGSDDNQNWEQLQSKIIPPNGYGILIEGPEHDPYVKLTGKTTNPGNTTIVDGFLTYMEIA